MGRCVQWAAERRTSRTVRAVAAGLTAASLWSIAPPAIAADPAAVTDVRVQMTEFSFAPTPVNITVPAGQPVHFSVVNNGVIPHDFGVIGVYEPPQTGIDPGRTETLTLQFPAPGYYQVYCPVPRHVDAGMRTVIRVVSADQAASAGQSATPSVDTPDGATLPAPDAAPTDASPSVDTAPTPAPEG